jgi:hypothetical protein
MAYAAFDESLNTLTKIGRRVALRRTAESYAMAAPSGGGNVTVWRVNGDNKPQERVSVRRGGMMRKSAAVEIAT